MHDHLADTLVRLSERGQPRGAASVLDQARRRVEDAPVRRPVRHAFAPDFAIAAVVLVTVAGLVTLRLVRSDPVSIDEPAPVTSTQTTTTESPDTDAAMVGADGALELAPVEGFDPVRLSTSIGEIEFTTWVHPDGEEPPWAMTETAHGVVGAMSPDGTLAWSADGITWIEIPFPTDADGWSDQSATGTDDLLVSSVDDGVVRASWDGTGWVAAEIFPDSRLDGAGATVVGRRGTVVVHNADVYYWNGAAFVEATRPPDPSLHAGSSPACSAHSWLGSGMLAELGPVAATDDGFIALAARNEDDWHSFPVCEPIVWFSTDGTEWAPTTDESPFGEGAVVRDIAVAGGRIVAGGGTSYFDAAVWVSDDAVTWEHADLDGAHILQVAGSDRGWVAAGHGNIMWFSPDGRTWDGPYERPPGWGDIWDIVGVAMLDDRIIGVGEFGGVAIEQSPASGVVIGVLIEE